MNDRHARTDTESARENRIVPWNWLERHAGSSLATGGVMLLASFVWPLGLAAVTQWAWAVGIVLAGIAVLSIAAGLLGLYPESNAAAPRLSSLGAVSATVAGAAALGLIGMAVAAVGAILHGVDLGKPMGIFAALALSMGGGLSTGMVAFGIALWTANGDLGVIPALLVGTGAALLVPVLGEVLRLGTGIAFPGLVLFPVLVGMSLVALTAGYELGRGGHSPRRSTG